MLLVNHFANLFDLLISSSTNLFTYVTNLPPSCSSRRFRPLNRTASWFTVYTSCKYTIESADPRQSIKVASQGLPLLKTHEPTKTLSITSPLVFVWEKMTPFVVSKLQPDPPSKPPTSFKKKLSPPETDGLGFWGVRFSHLTQPFHVSLSFHTVWSGSSILAEPYAETCCISETFLVMVSRRFLPWGKRMTG